jgi:hypothetical protein
VLIHSLFTASYQLASDRVPVPCLRMSVRAVKSAARSNASQSLSTLVGEHIYGASPNS